MNCEKGGRRNQFLDQWLKEFGWLQTRGSGDDLLMICTVIVENSVALCLTLTMLFRLSHSVKINHTLIKSWVVNTLMS